MFQSTFPHGERPYGGFYSLRGVWVSIHVPARGTTNGKKLAVFSALHRFFNFSAVTGVSIHVPARGTTAGGIPGEYPGSVSIHVPARGTTTASYTSMHLITVSIHVPARGTTFVRTAEKCF